MPVLTARVIHSTRSRALGYGGGIGVDNCSLANGPQRTASAARAGASDMHTVSAAAKAAPRCIRCIGNDGCCSLSCKTRVIVAHGCCGGNPRQKLTATVPSSRVAGHNLFGCGGRCDGRLGGRRFTERRGTAELSCANGGETGRL